MKTADNQTRIEIVQLTSQLIKILQRDYPNEKHKLIWELETFRKPILEALGEHFVQEITKL